MNKTLDAALTAFATRRLDEPYPYLILDARYERAREGGVIASQAALIAIAVASDGHRQVLAVDLANRESASSWRDFLLELKQRGLVCKSCAGSTTVARSPKCGATSPHG
jgi:putative transposase